MPVKSFKLLPPEYRSIPDVLKEDFPANFAIDLNGKTNAWEALVLIPFVAEQDVLVEEKVLVDAGL